MELCFSPSSKPVGVEVLDRVDQVRSSYWRLSTITEAYLTLSFQRSHRMVIQSATTSRKTHIPSSNWVECCDPHRAEPNALSLWVGTQVCRRSGSENVISSKRLVVCEFIVSKKLVELLHPFLKSEGLKQQI